MLLLIVLVMLAFGVGLLFGFGMGWESREAEVLAKDLERALSDRGLL